jgi:hypothetical protein
MAFLDHCLLSGSGGGGGKIVKLTTHQLRIQAIVDRLALSPQDERINNILEALQHLHLLSDSTPALAAPSPIDAFSAILADRLAYQPGERDLVLLHHELDVQRRDGQMVKNNNNNRYDLQF